MVIEHSNTSDINDGFELDLSQEHIEPMLQENLDRFVLFPIEQAESMGDVQAARRIVLDC